LKIVNRFDDVDDDDYYYVDDHDVGDDDDGDDDDDDDDASPVVIAGPGKTQAFAVYIYIVPYPHEIPSLNSIKTPLTMVGREHSHALRVKESVGSTIGGHRKLLINFAVQISMFPPKCRNLPTKPE